MNPLKDHYTLTELPNILIEKMLDSDLVAYMADAIAIIYIHELHAIHYNTAI